MENCSTVEITRITEAVENFRDVLEATQNVNNSDRTVMVEPEELQFITYELESVTDVTNTSLLPNDLENTISAVEIVLKLVSN